MNSDFKDTLILFITASKILGLVNFCYNMKTGLLYLNMKLTYYLFLELIRMFLLLSFTLYTLFKMNQEVNFSLVFFNIIKYWSIIIAARISEKWLIKYEYTLIFIKNKLTHCTLFRIELIYYELTNIQKLYFLDNVILHLNT